MVLALFACNGVIGEGMSEPPDPDDPDGPGMNPEDPPPVAGNPEAPPTVPTEPDPNRLDHEALFTCEPTELAGGTAPRVWRLTGAQFRQAARALLLDHRVDGFFTAAMGALDGLSSGRRYANYASAGAMDTPTLEAILSSAMPIGEYYVRQIRAGRSRELRDLQCMLETSPPAECRARFVDRTMPVAYRRPLSEEERTRWLARLDGWIEAHGGAEAVVLFTAQVVVSPPFLFRSELGEGAPDELGRVRLSSWEVASALAFTLTGSPPDGPLRAAAEADTLQDPTVVAEHATRLLGDASENRALQRFFEEYLGYPNAEGVVKDPNDIRMINRDRATPWRAPELVRNLRSRLDGLVGAPNFVDELFLGQIGTAPDRAGLLTDPSLMVAYSQPDGTDPIRRGRFITEMLLCNALPEITLDEIPPLADAGDRTERERLEAHRSDSACAGCHRSLDAIGLGLERFDGFGEWRDTEKGRPLDTTGVLLGAGEEDGPFDGPVELSERLARAPRTRQCMVRQTFRYFFGRNEHAEDACALAAADAAFLESGRFTDMVLAFFTSDAFLTRNPALVAPDAEMSE